jgi:hypothetical protein
MKDLLAYWRGELQNRLVVASLPLSEAAVEATSEQQAHLAVLLDTREHGTLVYSALWLSGETGERRVCWLVEPTLLEGAEAKLVGGMPPGRTLAQATDLQGEPCPDPSTALIEVPCRPSVDDWPELTRTEGADATRVVVRLTDEWWGRIEAGEQPELVPLGDGGCALALRFKPQNGAEEEKVELRFPTRVDAAGCTLQLSCSKRELTLVVPRAPYAFETRAMPELWLDDWHAWHSASHLNQEFFFIMSSMQVSLKERGIMQSARSRGREADLPPLPAIKGVVFLFFQSHEVERIQLRTPRSGAVALILHHGLRRDHRSGLFAADVSVCFMPELISDQVMPWWLKDRAIGHTIEVKPETLALFHSFVRLLASRAKDADSWTIPPSRAPAPAHLKPHFMRLLFPPLFAPDHIISGEDGGSPEPVPPRLSADESRLQALKLLKEDGARLVQQARYGDAIERFQKTLVCYQILVDRGEATAAAGTPLAARCYLNLAHCLLEARSPAKAGEVEVCCRAALDLLEKPGGGGTPALLAKAHYRMGLARELSGDREGAAEALGAALRCTPKEQTIQEAMKRLELSGA